MSEIINAPEETLWYKDGIIYQVHIKAYRDSNNDGMGDFRGLIEKLDYIANLGVNVIWLLPFYPSPLRDDGYDIADYYKINPQYGTLDNFKEFLREAHKRGIKVITELVLNHTSDQHKWFQLARISKPGSVQRDYYVWSDTPEKYSDARIIFGDFETSNWTWDPAAKAYYWHRFYSHQPDLNFENPNVHKALFRVVDFWFELGVDGLRLDAVPYLYEREGTNCENLPETHEFLKKLNAHVKSKFQNKMLLAEANQWPEDAVAYLGMGDECQMAFHFPLMPRIFMSIQMEDRFPIIDILEQTPPIPESCQWAMFLRNHDELTLEMVTDEERDYMYRFYASESRARINLGIRRRLAPLVENNRRKIELLNILLFSFPGTPIIYYGDEIGMGDNFYLGDRNGVRTPMQWSPDRNAGFSSVNPQKLFLPVIIDPEYHFEAVNVEVQERSTSSILNWMKKAIATRKNYKAFGRGTIEFLSPGNGKVLAFLRKYEEQVILVVANLSRFSQAADLDLAKYNGYIPIEIFSRNKFPVIKDSLYSLTLNGFDYFWFSLELKKTATNVNKEKKIPEITVTKNWKELVNEEQRRNLFEETIIADYVYNSNWFDVREKNVSEIKIMDAIFLSETTSEDALFLLRVNFLDSLPEVYLLPVSFLSVEKSKNIIRENPSAIIAQIRIENQAFVLLDGIYSESFRQNLLKMIIRKRKVRTSMGELFAAIEKRIKRYFSGGKLFASSQLTKADARYIQIMYDNTLIIKLYRKLSEGINPGIEILKNLTEYTTFPNIPPFAGGIYYYSSSRSLPITIGLLKEHTSYQTEAWHYMIDAAKQFFENVLAKNEALENFNYSAPSLIGSRTHTEKEVSQETFPEIIYSEMISLLGRRIAEMHIALNSITNESTFIPESFSMLYQRSLYQSMRTLIKSTFRLLNKSLEAIPENLRNEGMEIIKCEQTVLNYISRFLKGKISARKIRIHGDLHLGQVLFTGKDFVFINFEGNASVSITERKLKRSPLRDVASMVWSFYFASATALNQYKSSSTESLELLEKYSDSWWQRVTNLFLTEYIEIIKDSGLLPEEKDELEFMLCSYMLEKNLAELNYALTINPEKALIPLKGIRLIIAFLQKPEREKPLQTQ